MRKSYLNSCKGQRRGGGVTGWISLLSSSGRADWNSHYYGHRQMTLKCISDIVKIHILMFCEEIILRYFNLNIYVLQYFDIFR